MDAAVSDLLLARFRGHFGYLGVIFVGIVAIDMPIARAGSGIDGTFALLETAGGCFCSIPFIAHPAVSLGVDNR